MFNKLKHQKWTLLWAFVVMAFCFAKFPEGPKEPSLFFEGFDKVVHLGLFFVLSVFLFLGKINSKTNFTYFTFFKIIVCTALFGGGIELLQKYVFTYRGAEWWDFISDMLGVSMVVFCFVVLNFKTYFNETKN
ncbi:MAG: VanZ family protein [Sphingobacteriaceae bacterium]|nr:VanZ family protein [Sphingobacteriaceae bacterium]